MPLSEYLASIAARLHSKGFHRISPWWTETLGNFWASGKRQLVLRVGRRGGKSTTLCLVAVLEALFGEHQIPGGDVGVVAIVSVNKDEAGSRLRTICWILDRLGVRYTRVLNSVELDDKPIIFKTFAATTTAVVGFTSIVVIADEAALWRSEDTAANPAEVVLGALLPTTASVPTAHVYISSSALSTVDHHYELFERGDTEYQMVAEATTWESNPTITQEFTRSLEPNLRSWRRHYANIPSSSVAGCFDEDQIERAFNDTVQGVPNPVLVIDASSGRKDSFTWGVVGWNKNILRVEQLCSVEGGSGLTAEQIVGHIAQTSREHGLYRVFGDQREAFALASLFSSQGMSFTELCWTAQSKPAAIERLRTMFKDGQISIETSAKKMKKELMQFEERINANGAFTYGARGNGHDDFVSILITAAMADLEGLMPGSVLAEKIDWEALELLQGNNTGSSWGGISGSAQDL